MRKNRFLSLLMMATMLVAAAVFTACSSDDDSPKNDPNVIIAGENDPLGQPIGLADGGRHAVVGAEYALNNAAVEDVT